MPKPARPAALVPAKPVRPALLPDLRHLILTAREQVARAVDGRLALLYWEMGKRIRQDVLREQRADYGERIVATLSRQLVREFGSGYEEKSLRRMLQFSPDRR